MPRKVQLDPILENLLKQRAKAQADAERWQAELKRRQDKARRAERRMHEAQREIDRIDNLIDNYYPPASAEGGK